MDEFWPGRVTLVFEAADIVPRYLTAGTGKIGIRLSGHPVAAALCTACDSPLVSTSANPAGRPPARNALGVRLMFGSAVDFIVHGEVGGADSPTSIRDLVTGKLIRA